MTVGKMEGANDHATPALPQPARTRRSPRSIIAVSVSPVRALSCFAFAMRAGSRRTVVRICQGILYACHGSDTLQSGVRSRLDRPIWQSRVWHTPGHARTGQRAAPDRYPCLPRARSPFLFQRFDGRIQSLHAEAFFAGAGSPDLPTTLRVSFVWRAAGR
jgi:hypothetical protein